MIRSPALLLPLLALAAVIESSAQSSPTVPYIQTKPSRVVCTQTYLAFDVCGPVNGTIDGYTGYEPELFKRVATILADSGHPEWAVGNWSFYCTSDWTAALNQMTDPDPSNRLCDVIVSGVSATTERQNAGMQFSYSVYQSGRKIMIHQGPVPGMWKFLDPFETSVWLLMFGSSVVVGLVVLLLEMDWSLQPSARCTLAQQPSQAGSKAPSSDSSRTGATSHVRGGGGSSDLGAILRQVWNRYSSIQWAATGIMLHGGFLLAPRTTGARVVVLGSFFVAVLLLCIYTAAYTAQIAVASLKSPISSISDLYDLPVGIFEEDSNAFSAFPLRDVVPLPWDNDQQEAAMIQLLRSGKIAALILDAPFVDYTTATNCDLFEVGATLLPNNIGFVFPPDVPIGYLQLFDVALQTLQDQGTTRQLSNAYLTPLTPCSGNNPTSAGLKQIQLEDIGGLWVFMASCIGLGILWNLASCLLRNGVKRLCAVGSDAEGPSELEGGCSGKSRPSSVPQLGQPSTMDEALQKLEWQANMIDEHIRHLPYVFSAIMDAKLAALHADLTAGSGASSHNTAMANMARGMAALNGTARSTMNSHGAAQQPGSRLDSGGHADLRPDGSLRGLRAEANGHPQQPTMQQPSQVQQLTQQQQLQATQQAQFALAVTDSVNRLG